MRKIVSLILLMSMILLAGCGSIATKNIVTDSKDVYIDRVEIDAIELEDESVALAELPYAAVSQILVPVANGEKEVRNEKGVIDYSNLEKGYVMAQFLTDSDKRLKAQVKGPNTTYTYNLTAKTWATFPLSDGNGEYKVTIYENVTGNKYANVASAAFSVILEDEFAPFLYPNQYVDYAVAEKTIAQAEALCGTLERPIDKVGAIYQYVVTEFTYDKEKAATVQSGYLPVLDQVLEEKKGICFDYAALMTGMLRSQNIPCKLVVGYAGDAYHAWISVWSEESGWIEGIIFFDGKIWQRMDPTFASAGEQSKAIMEYIGDGSHYTTKYLY